MENAITSTAAPASTSSAAAITGKGRMPPTGGAAAPITSAETAVDFQAMLQSLMLAPATADSGTALEPESLPAVDDAEHGSTPDAPLPAGLLPALPDTVAVAAQALAGAAAAAVATLPAASGSTVPANSDDPLKVECPATDPSSKRDTTRTGNALGNDLPPMTERRAPAHVTHGLTQHPQHALEALAEHRDAAVSDLPVPSFEHGPHQLHPTHPAHPTHPLHPTHPSHLSSDASARIESQIGTPQWSTEFAQKIVWLAGEKQQTAELHVNPPELGPLRIQLSTDDTQTSAIFSSEHSEVRAAIEAGLPRLREVLADSGITLGNASVTADSPRDGAAFDQQRNPRAAFDDRTAADDGGRPSLDAASEVMRTRGKGLVDLFA